LAYGTEFFIAAFSGNPYEQFVFLNRAAGPFAWAYWTMVSCNVLIPQLLWLRPLRRNLAFVFFISIVVNVGMWFERFVIIVTSLHRDFLPSSWADYAPTIIEIATLIGSFGLFFSCFLIFCRFIPAIAMAEVKGVLKTPRRPREHDAALQDSALRNSAKGDAA
jgi:molybdopterin-containing oxidoreductase family membrane subunit